MKPTDKPVAWIEHHKGGDNLCWDEPGGKKSALYNHPAPALTAELREELLEALKFGQDAADNELTDAYNADEENPCRYEVIDCRTTELKKIKAAITKITNLGETK